MLSVHTDGQLLAAQVLHTAQGRNVSTIEEGSTGPRWKVILRRMDDHAGFTVEDYSRECVKKMQGKLQGQDLQVAERKKQHVAGVLFTAYHLLLKSVVVNAIEHIGLRCSDVTAS